MLIENSPAVRVRISGGLLFSTYLPTNINSTVTILPYNKARSNHLLHENSLVLHQKRAVLYLLVVD